jgi:uncharacterized protein YoaH (UPF0181 family)
MNAYQNFLDFFSMRNKERLDGLSESDFTPMTREERGMAFELLLKRVEKGGTEESVNGLFRADERRAIETIKRLLASGALNGEAQILAAWNLYRIERDPELLAVFIRFMSDHDAELREKAAYYVPSDTLTDELKYALQAMIRTETEQMALINAVNKLLACYEVTRESVDKETFSRFYRGLRSDDLAAKEKTFARLDSLYE